MADEFLEEDTTEIQKVSDVTQAAGPVYYDQQIDQMILTPEARSNLLSKKIPRIIKKPIYALDDYGNKIPVQQEDGSDRINDKGEIMYVIKDYEEIQSGWQTELDIIPSPELFTIDNATSNISQAAVTFLTRTYWFSNYLSVYQYRTNLDYSIYLHKLRNDAHTVLAASKSYNGGTVQAIKTFINKTDAKQWLQKEDEPKKANPLNWLLGGQKKKKPEPTNTQQFTGFAGP